MTGDTNMKKENTINQEQEEMVFAEAPAQVIFNEKKEPDDIVKDDAEEIDEEDYEIEVLLCLPSYRRTRCKAHPYADRFKHLF